MGRDYEGRILVLWLVREMQKHFAVNANLIVNDRFSFTIKKCRAAHNVHAYIAVDTSATYYSIIVYDMHRQLFFSEAYKFEQRSIDMIILKIITENKEIII